MRVILTNDDGIEAKGILVLARALYEEGHDVMLVAPREEASGSSAATGRWWGEKSRAVAYELVALDLPSSIPCYGVSALPALCVAIALTGAFGELPDCVVSGINRGRNAGGSILHSGTVGAALTAVNLGIPGVAMSIEAHREEPHYETAAQLGMAFVDAAPRLPRGVALNLNVPDLPLAEVRGIRSARVGNVPVVTHAEAIDGEIALKRGLRHAETLLPGTDEYLTNAGYATVTLIVPPHEVDVALADDLIERATGSVNQDVFSTREHPAII